MAAARANAFIPINLLHINFFFAVQLPVPAYLLALVYFFLSVMSVFVLVGLRARKTRLILAWILLILLSFFPEAGMVLYMAVYYWVSNGRSKCNHQS